MLGADSPKMSSAVLKAYLVEKLRDAIVARRYNPGDRLNETNLALQFNVSRVAVREALMQLQQQGLVMNHPRRGMFVNSLAEEEAQKINSVRILLEAEALRLCRAKATKPMIKHLDSLVTQMERWQISSQFETADLDLQFHRALWLYSGNSYLAKSLNSIVPILFAHRALGGISDEQMHWQLNHHRSLLEIVEGKSSESPEQAILAHLRIGYSDPAHFSSLTIKKSK
jgi:DNA-binding GntR family transcriptional regulator